MFAFADETLMQNTDGRGRRTWTAEANYKDTTKHLCSLCPGVNYHSKILIKRSVDTKTS